MRIAWVTDRRVHQVRVIDKIPPPFPPDPDFEGQDDQGSTTFRLRNWIGYVSTSSSIHSFQSKTPLETSP